MSLEYVIMIGIALSGKTTYVKANFTHEEIRLYYFDNDRKKEMNYIEQCLFRFYMPKSWLASRITQNLQI